MAPRSRAARRPERLAGGRDAPPVPGRPLLGQRELAGLLLRTTAPTRCNRRPGIPRSPGPSRPPSPPPPPPPAAAPESPPGDPLRGGGGPHRPQHGGQPGRPHRHQLPRGSGQTARRQPPDRQRATWAAPTGARCRTPHLIAYAVVQAIARHMPVMNSTFIEADPSPRVVRHDHIGLGIAVDVEKADGSRTLLVPCIPEAGHARLPQLRGALRHHGPQGAQQRPEPRRFRRRHRQHHQPRHHRHRAVGTPASCPAKGSSSGWAPSTTPPPTRPPTPARWPTWACRKVITLSSTYDHRIIQGAESGMFLGAVHELLLGKHSFYDDIFRAVGVPY